MLLDIGANLNEQERFYMIEDMILKLIILQNGILIIIILTILISPSYCKD